jgi:hypothetical protein
LNSRNFEHIDSDVYSTARSYSDFVSYGIGYTFSDILPLKPGFTFSVCYGHRISDILELEASLRFFQRIETNSWKTYTLSYVPPLTLSTITSSITAHSTSFDVGAVIIPFKNDLKALRFGAGVSIRRAGIMASYETISQNPTLANRVIVWNEEVGLGSMAKIEYLFPLAERVDIGLNLQGHTFFYSFYRANKQPFYYIANFLPNTSLSLGAFLRINF